MKIYTKTGDKGDTSLFGGKRVSKANIRIEAYGTVDELLSYIGLVRDQEVNISKKEELKEIQDRLFTLGATLAADPDKPKLKKPDLHEEDIQLLETWIDKMEVQLQPLTHFVLPGGHQAVSFCHLSRVVCRRAERRVIEMMDHGDHVESILYRYLNRLSDYLFVLSRWMAKELNAEELKWIPRDH
ncbi:cob(I)yrinic acid a,c-diamide adenosyltransferase [Algivirga pacifica]